MKENNLILSLYDSLFSDTSISKRYSNRYGSGIAHYGISMIDSAIGLVPIGQSNVSSPNEFGTMNQTGQHIPYRFTDKALRDEIQNLKSSITDCEVSIADLQIKIPYEQTDLNIIAERTVGMDPFWVNAYERKFRYIEEKKEELKSCTRKKSEYEFKKNDLESSLSNTTPEQRAEYYYNELINRKNSINDKSNILQLAQDFYEMGNYKNAPSLLAECEELILKKIYKHLVNAKNNASTEDDYMKIAQQFREMNGYADTIELAEECETSRKQCEEKRLNAKKNEHIALLNAAKAKMVTMQRSIEYDNLATEFTNIRQNFQSFSGEIDVQAQIEECETCRKQCEEKKYQCKKDETIALLNAANAKMVNLKSSNEYGNLAREFTNIRQNFQSFSGEIDVQTQIKECEACRKQCEEKKFQCKKDETIILLNATIDKMPKTRKAVEYGALAAEFAGIGQSFQSFSGAIDVQAQIEECEAYRAQCEEKKRIILRNEKITRVTGSVLYFLLTTGLVLLVCLFRGSFQFLMNDGGRILAGVLFTIGCAIIGFFVVRNGFLEDGAFLFLGLLIGGVVGYFIGYFLTEILWIMIAAIILALSVLLFIKEIKADTRLRKQIIVIAAAYIIIFAAAGYNFYNGTFAFLFNRHLSIPANVTVIEKGEYAGGQFTSVAIPASVTEIGENAFTRNGLTYVKIPESVTAIGDYAFANNRITSIVIEANVNLGNEAFGYGFEQNYRSNGMAAGSYLRSSASSYDWSAWHGDIGFQHNDGEITITGYKGTGGHAVIPGEISGYPVTVIREYSFKSKNLSSVAIPDSVTSIESFAFQENRITGVAIPNSVQSIDHSAFSGNPITSVSIGANVELGSNGDRVGVLGQNTGFNGAYENSGKRAGTYTRVNNKTTSWTRK